MRLVNYGNGPLILQNEQPRNVAYLVFEDAYINFSLHDCLTLGRFQERHAKLIFKKILNGIQAIHNANYCHRNISLSNIIFDHNYNPKIYSFDFSCLNANNSGGAKCSSHFVFCKSLAFKQLKSNENIFGL